MSKISQIKQEIYGIEGGAFQEVCNRYLVRTYGGELHSPGSVGDKTKTKPGRPDTYLVQEDSTYVLAEITTHDSLTKPKYREKLISDLQGCLKFESLGITANQVRCIVLCCNSSIDIDLREELKQLVADFKIPLHFVPQMTLVDYFYSIDKVFARDYWGVAFETGQILSKQDFLNRYQAGGFATPLDNKLHGRERESLDLLQLLEAHHVLLVSGQPGVGKSRLVMEVMDDFVDKHPHYLQYYVMSKPESIIEDLLSFLRPGSSYILLIDDANRQLDNLLSILDRVISSKLDVKIVLTVREYGRASVEEALYPTPFKNYHIDILSDQVIEQILFEEPFNIRRIEFRERITAISNGNARLAIMAAEAVKKTPDIIVLRDVTAIYDEYFKSILKDASALSDDTTLKVLGLLSFFHTIDRDVLEEIAVINDFGISLEAFMECVNVLEPLELIDVDFKSVVKISDQVLGTYFFFDVFLRKHLLDAEHLLFNYFQRFNYRVRDTFLPAISTFGIENTVGANAELLTRIYDRISGNTDDCYAFFDVFGIYLPDKVFGFVHRIINVMPVDETEFEFINAYKNRQPNEHDRTLLLLAKFYDSTVAAHLTAMGLAIRYVHKCKAMLDMLVGQLKAPLNLGYDAVHSNFERQRAVYQFLKDHIDDSPAYKYLFYYVLQPVFLDKSYDYRVFTTIDGKTTFNPTFAALREGFLQDIDDSFQQDRLICYDLLMEYLQPHGRGTYEYLHADQSQLLSLIKNHFVPENFEDAYFVLAYTDLLSDRQIKIIPELRTLRRKYNTKIQRIWHVLALERDKNGKKFDRLTDFREEYDAKIRRIKEGFKINNLNDFMAVYRAVKAFIDFKYHHRHSIFFGFTLLIEHVFEKDIELGFEVLSIYLSENDLASIISGRIFNTLFQLNIELHQRVYKLVKSISFKKQQDWIERFYEVLPDELVSEVIIDRMLDDFIGVNSHYKLHTPWFEKYENVRPGVIHDIAVTLMNKHADDTTFEYELPHHFFSEYPYFSEHDFKTACQLYLQQERLNGRSDPYGEDLFFLVQKDVCFFQEYIDYRIGVYKQYHTPPRAPMSPVWGIDGAPDLVYEALVKLHNADIYSFGFKDFSESFFVQLGAEQASLAVALMERLLHDFSADAKMLDTIWEVSRNLMEEHYGDLIRGWVVTLPDLELFKKCDWTNNSFSWSGQRKVWAEFRETEYKLVYDAISELPDSFLYVEYQEWLVEKMSKEKEYSKYERRRIFRGFD